jgi:hypothetical protein
MTDVFNEYHKELRRLSQEAEKYKDVDVKHEVMLDVIGLMSTMTLEQLVGLKVLAKNR